MRSIIKNKIYLLRQVGCIFLISLPSCKKLVEIPPPASSITLSQVYADSADAASGIAGIYTVMAGNGQTMQFANGGVSIFCGSSSDELVQFNLESGGPSDVYRNALTSTNSVTGGIF